MRSKAKPTQGARLTQCFFKKTAHGFIYNSPNSRLSGGKKLETMKIIFLDIDGVLNSQTWLKNGGANIEGDLKWFDPRCVELLNDLTSSTGSSIVVSSTWRTGKTVDQLKRLLSRMGVTGEVISKTGQSESGIRGVEIHEWMLMNQHLLGCLRHEFQDYVILDDDSDMLYWQRHNYFQVDGYCGLTPGLIYRAKNFLKPLKQ